MATPLEKPKGVLSYVILTIALVGILFALYYFLQQRPLLGYIGGASIIIFAAFIGEIATSQEQPGKSTRKKTRH